MELLTFPAGTLDLRFTEFSYCLNEIIKVPGKNGSSELRPHFQLRIFINLRKGCTMSSLETRSPTRIRIDAVQRLAMWHCFSGHTPFVRVCEYPKSGGTWLGQLIAGYLEIPFPRNRRPAIAKMQPCVLHGHHLYHERVKNIVCIVRDGRDVITSAYFHILHHHRSFFMNDAVWKVLPSNDYRDVMKNMPAFIEYMFTKPTFGGKRFARKQVSWRTFVQSWFGKDANIVRYEDMLKDTPAAVAPLLHRLTGEVPDTHRLQEIAEQFSFKNQTARSPGEEDTGSFLRKGIAGDWRSKFSDEACQVFKHFAGDALIQAGYEQDLSWSNGHSEDTPIKEIVCAV